ncbi:arginase family protein [Nocardiopsis sp. HNM0947]|uniref:Arginase family protein n=1 Tax=Nocardiopsis coralli TaxID=2772213 RepID=A0ABR9PB35_9ACTN|nr:arginase family protein [Nocardiopsis coralli]MBE3001061.1 arginase family protein [Nocardiopsis coralli]
MNDAAPGPAEAPAITDDTLLTTEPLLAMRGARNGRTTVWHTREGWEIEVGPATADLLAAFAVPRTLATFPDGGATDRSRLRTLVTALGERGLVRRHDPDGVPTPAGRGGMFGAPVLTLAEALRGEACDVVFAGMPYDLGASHRPGSRFGPAQLRRTGGAVFRCRDTVDGPPGAVDPVTGNRVLAGVRLADIGDVTASVHRSAGPTWSVLENVVGRLAGHGRLPVVLGGDHSVTLPVVRGLTGVHGELGVLHIDAHGDYARPRRDDAELHCHHGNVMDWVVGDPRVVRLAQFGLRQLEDPPARPDEALRRWPGTSALRTPLADILAELPEGLPYHLTVDVDALDPSVLSATGTPLPGGFTHAQLVGLLTDLCSARRIVGIDVVEFLPQEGETDGLIISDLLLRALDAATAPRGGAA